MTKTNKKSQNAHNKCSVKKTIIKNKKTKKQKAIPAATTSFVKTTIEMSEYCRAQEWIHDNAMPWVEFEKIKLETEKGRALLDTEIESIKETQFQVEKLVDQDQFGDTVKWKNYPYKYNSVYDSKLSGKYMMNYCFFNFNFKFCIFLGNEKLNESFIKALEEEKKSKFVFAAMLNKSDFYPAQLLNDEISFYRKSTESFCIKFTS
jgi:hypothetical protein